MIRGVHHTSITTPDLDRSLSFYRDLLGFEMVLENEWHADNPGADRIYGLTGTAVRMAMLRTANSFLELFEFAAPAGKTNDPARPVCDAGVTHISVVVDDIEAEYSRLSQAGIRFHCPPQHVPGWTAATYARDPDGNIVELMQPDPAGPLALDLPPRRDARTGTAR